MLFTSGVGPSYIECIKESSKKGFCASPLKLKETGILENTSSFSIDFDKELYYDFSEYDGRKAPRGGSILKLVEHLGGVLPAKISSNISQKLEVEYAKLILAKHKHNQQIAAYLKEIKPLWGIETILDCPTIGYDEVKKSLVFIYCKQSTSANGQCIFKISNRGHIYPLENRLAPKEWINIENPKEEISNGNLNEFVFVAGQNLVFSNDDIVIPYTELEILLLTEGEPDAITISQYQPKALCASWKNSKIPRVPGLEICGVFYDIGAKDLAQGVITKANGLYQRCRLYLFKDEEFLDRNYDITDYLQNIDQDPYVSLHLFMQNFAETVAGINVISKATFLPLTMADEGQLIRRSFVSRVKELAKLNAEMFDKIRHSERIDFRGNSSENIIVTTADTFVGKFKGKSWEKYTVLEFTIPCAEMEVNEEGKPGEKCEACSVFHTRKLLSSVDANTVDISRWIDIDIPQEIELSIFPGAPLTKIHKSSSTVREYREIYKQFGLQCSFQTLPKAKPVETFVLTYGDKDFQVATLFAETAEKVRSRNPFTLMQVYGYWCEGIFVLLDFEEVEQDEFSIPPQLFAYDHGKSIFRFQKPTDDSDEAYLRLEDTISDIELYLGRIGYSNRNMFRTILASMLSGCYFGDMYMGHSILLLGEPDSGKSFLTQKLSELFAAEQCLIPISNVQKTTFKLSAVRAQSNAQVPEIVKFSGYSMVLDGYQPDAKINFEFSDIDAITISGHTTASGVLASDTFGNKPYEAATPILVLGNTPSGDTMMGAKRVYYDFFRRIKCENIQAGQKRFALVVAPARNINSKVVNVGNINTHILEQAREFFAFKFNTMHVPHNAEIKEFLLNEVGLYSQDSFYVRRVLHIANLLRLFRLSKTISKTDIATASRLIIEGVFSYADGAPEQNEERSLTYFWHKYDMDGTEFSKYMSKLDDDEVVSIMTSILQNRGGTIYFLVSRLKELIPEANADVRKFMGISTKERNFEEMIMPISKPVVAMFRRYLSDRGGNGVI
jgi:hypothetical protein